MPADPVRHAFCSDASSPQELPQPVSPSPEASRPVARARVAWSRTRLLAVIMVLAAAALVGLTVVARQAGQDAIDLQATLWLQRITFRPFAALMYWVSWVGFSPQNLALPVIVAGAFALRGFRVEAIWLLGTSASAVVTTVLKELVHRPRQPRSWSASALRCLTGASQADIRFSTQPSSASRSTSCSCWY